MFGLNEYCNLHGLVSVCFGKCLYPPTAHSFTGSQAPPRQPGACAVPTFPGISALICPLTLSSGIWKFLEVSVNFVLLNFDGCVRGCCGGSLAGWLPISLSRIHKFHCLVAQKAVALFHMRRTCIFSYTRTHLRIHMQRDVHAHVLTYMPSHMGTIWHSAQFITS